jgi:hypothetical protein
MVSRMYSESRTVPGTTTAPIPATWSFTGQSTYSEGAVFPRSQGVLKKSGRRAGSSAAVQRTVTA